MDPAQPPRARPARHARQRGRDARGRRQQHAGQGADAVPVCLHDGHDGRVQRALHQFPRARLRVFRPVDDAADRCGDLRRLSDDHRAVDRRRRRVPAGPARVQGDDADRPPDRPWRAVGRDDPVRAARAAVRFSRDACRGRGWRAPPAMLELSRHRCPVRRPARARRRIAVRRRRRDRRTRRPERRRQDDAVQRDFRQPAAAARVAALRRRRHWRACRPMRARGAGSGARSRFRNRCTR